MIFHSFDFLAFFAIVVTIYWRLPHRGQNLLLLGASYVFYGWVHPWFVILMLASTTVDYWAAQRMEDNPGRRKAYLYASLGVNLGMLGVFKYYNFFIDNVRELMAGFGLTVSPPLLELVLPAGISFYTFQALSYTVEVYWGHMKARRNAVDFALFVAFFPHLVAGPIMRATNLLVQVEEPRRWDAAIARDAVLLILWGFVKKLVVADNVGVIANRVFSHTDPSFEMLWAGVFAFGIQIYADFSAYSAIARGTARWFGFELILNFNHPYIAHSPTDFWHRWHISLSTWFRDFVYIPLGGSRVGALQRDANLLATFLISGLWHGASWNYVLWGLYHGSLLVVTRTIGAALKLPEKWPGPLALVQIVLTVTAAFAGWLFFRETNPDFLRRWLVLSPAASTVMERQVGLYLFVLAATWGVPLFLDDLWALGRERGWRLVGWAETRWEALGSASTSRALLQGAAAGVLLTLILVLRSRVSLDFIYFQF
ncbi:MAG: MBOAT family protein [Acidobacteria bacterium]|nr:MBOAT family protein [Acidobacteriota bacterium]